MLPSPSDLTYFVEIASTKNLSRAGERLGITQPSLSLAIKRLESAVGTALLIRNARGVGLTQAGTQLLKHAKQLLQTWENVRAEALASMNEIRGSYSIGCHPSVALYSLPGFLPDLLVDHPGLEIILKHDLSRKITEAVISSEVDVGIVVNPVRHPDLVIKKLCDDRVTFWSASAGGEKIGPLTSGQVLVCDTDLLQTQDLLKRLRSKGVEFGRVVTSTNLEVVRELVASGCGVGILPSRVANRASGAGLIELPQAPVFLDEICVLYRAENQSVRSVQAICEAIKVSFRKSN